VQSGGGVDQGPGRQTRSSSLVLPHRAVPKEMMRVIYRSHLSLSRAWIWGAGGQGCCVGVDAARREAVEDQGSIGHSDRSMTHPLVLSS
jgi:hypothetical protein